MRDWRTNRRTGWNQHTPTPNTFVVWGYNFFLCPKPKPVLDITLLSVGQSRHMSIDLRGFLWKVPQIAITKINLKKYPYDTSFLFPRGWYKSEKMPLASCLTAFSPPLTPMVCCCLHSPWYHPNWMPTVGPHSTRTICQPHEHRTRHMLPACYSYIVRYEPIIKHTIVEWLQRSKVDISNI